MRAKKKRDFLFSDEQCELKAEAEVLRQEIETQEQQNQNLELFIQKVRKYADKGDLCRGSG